MVTQRRKYKTRGGETGKNKHQRLKEGVLEKELGLGVVA